MHTPSPTTDMPTQPTSEGGFEKEGDVGTRQAVLCQPAKIPLLSPPGHCLTWPGCQENPHFRSAQDILRWQRRFVRARESTLWALGDSRGRLRAIQRPALTVRALFAGACRVCRAWGTVLTDHGRGIRHHVVGTKSSETGCGSPLRVVLRVRGAEDCQAVAIGTGKADFGRAPNGRPFGCCFQ